MDISMHDKRRTKEYSFYYGTLDMYRRAVAEALGAGNDDFTRLECSKIYHMLKDIKLPENYNPDVECYCKKFNVHEAFLKIFGLGRYKYNGVEWY